MAYRFTNTDKWLDAWFSSLSNIEMLLFLYLCDNCDIAGFIEINIKRWGSDLNTTPNVIKGALKGLERGFIYSNNKDCIYLRNFLKHQKNLPLQDNNKAHIGIIRRFNANAYKFNIQDIREFIEGASKGLQCPIGIGNGIGNGIGKGLVKELPEMPENPKRFIPPSLENDVYSFSDFWNDYDKKVGDKDKIEKKFEKLSEEIKLKIKEHIPKYKNSQPDKQYRKNPETYLNNKSWNDEIIEQIDKNNQTKPDTKNVNSKWKK